MRTYDTRGGRPISPNVPDVAPSGLEEEVLESLERLDEAHSRAKALFEDVFLRLVKHRYPTDAVVDLRRVCAVYDPGAAQGRVTRHFKPDINLDRPEATHVSVECVMLRKDGSETRTVICFSEPVLGRDYVWSKGSPAPRDELIKLIGQMEESAAAETIPAP